MGQDNKIFFVFGMIIMIMITVFMIIMFIGFAIQDNAKTIGVLRSLGVAKKDTLKIFIIEALLLSILSCIFAIWINIGAIDWINNYLMKGENERKFMYCCSSIGGTGIVSAFTIIIGMVAAIVPIRGLAKKRPMEIMR